MSPIRTGDRDRSLTTTPNLNDPEPSSKVSSSKPQTGVIIIDSDSDHESSRNANRAQIPNPNAVQHVKYQRMLENNSITSSASTLEHLNAMGLLPILRNDIFKILTFFKPENLMFFKRFSEFFL